MIDDVKYLLLGVIGGFVVLAAFCIGGHFGYAYAYPRVRCEVLQDLHEGNPIFDRIKEGKRGVFWNGRFFDR